MDFLMLVIVLVILVTLFGGRIRRNRAIRPLRVAAPVPTFQVVALGQPGSGKTLLLASMYHALRVPADQRYFLTAPHDDVLRLNRWFDQMANTASPAWPHGTSKGETRLFTFAVKTRATGTLSTIFQLNYLEYAGELLTELQEPGSTSKDELFERIGSADALIGVIDGHGIRQYVDGHPEGAARLAETLNALVPAITEAWCPVNFVITKWDLLADLHPDENTRLSMVRNVLMSNAQFRAMVNLHSAGRVVRIIPVSAVGPGFARIGSAGEVVKVPRSEIRPANVDVPLSVVAPDLFEQVEGRLTQEARAALEAEVRRRTLMSPLDALASLAAFAGQTAGRMVMAAFGGPVVALGDSLLGLFLDSQAGGASERVTGLDRELSEAEHTLDRLRLARQHVLQDMRGKVIGLETRLPSARLSDGR
jgi:Double-GTPase 2